jgi:hypothetical protein
MSKLSIEVETQATSMDDLRSALDAAFQAQFPGGMMKRQWNGDVLELIGPGATGSIQMQDGLLVGEASLKPPASMMKAMIEQKVGDAMRAAVASGD